LQKGEGGGTKEEKEREKRAPNSPLLCSRREIGLAKRKRKRGGKWEGKGEKERKGLQFSCIRTFVTLKHHLPAHLDSEGKKERYEEKKGEREEISQGPAEDRYSQPPEYSP